MVDAVNSRLRPKPERADPVVLRANADKSFIGSYVFGKGFVLTPEERDVLLASDACNAERIFPYLGGEEINTSPTHGHHRYVVDFGDMTLEQAERWPDLVAILREKVKPERDELKDNPDGRRRKKYWWLFGRHTPSLYRAIAQLDRCLVTPTNTKYPTFAFQPTNRVFSHKLVVFTFDDDAHFGILQSRAHWLWVKLLTGTYGSVGTYSPSDCFETFPLPGGDLTKAGSSLSIAGRTLYQRRGAFMVSAEQGLTEIYNALKDPDDSTPDILELRSLHETLDRAVLDAYGQSHIEVPPYCGATPAALERFEDEVLDFLFALNEKLASEEARAAKRARV